MKRNEFFKLAMSAGLSAKLALAREAVEKPVTAAGPLPRRPLGKTGEKVSIIGFGGNVVKNEEQDVVRKVVAEAIEAGVNYFDNSPRYGNTEVKLGPVLEPFRRKIFLACKTGIRDAAGARLELEHSLELFRTDHFDLYQLHYLHSREDIEQAFGPGGAMETLVKARQEGLARFLGFSAHTVEAAQAAMERFDFDTIMFPFNYVAWYKGNFGSQIVEKAAAEDMGILAIKPGASCRRVGDTDRRFPKCWYVPLVDEEDAALSYYFTLSLPVSSAFPPGEVELFRLALKVARSFIPLSESEKAELARQAASLPPLFEYPAWKS
ncbi:MAG: aldo/keto reductase [Candidatus Glassbacteria bacterium]|nr:aldo/keto reductase [Candidatus Glassbacteria bacterium]